MRFTPQTKRFALVPVEPGNEKDTDVLLCQDHDGDVAIKEWCSIPCDGWLAVEESIDREAIAALGFPITGEDA